MVNPIGDFPLNDDWQYAYPVKQLIISGQYEMISEIAPNIFLQVWWGYLICEVLGGFSFTYLRWASLILVPFFLYLFFAYLEKNQSSKEAGKLCLLMGFNPIFFSLAFSFMSEITFLSLMITSLFGYLSYYKSHREWYRWLGFSMAILSIFVRQQGLFIIISFEIASMIYANKHKKNIFRSILMMGIGIGIYLGIEKLLKPWLGVASHYIQVDHSSIESLIYNPQEAIFDFTTRLLMAIFYLGFFTLPFIFRFYLWFQSLFSKYKILLIFILTVNLIISLGAYFWLGRIFPYGGNIFFNLGLGPELLYDRYPLRLDSISRLNPLIMVIGGYLCQLNGSLLLISLIKSIVVPSIPKWGQFHIDSKNLGYLRSNLFLSIFIILIFTAGSIFSFFDRHLLPIFVAILLLIPFHKMNQAGHNTYWLLLIFFIFFSVAATKDYLSWNRVSKEAVEQLVAKGISNRLIDGGHARNGWINNREVKHEYLITFRPLNGSIVLEIYPYFSWLYLRKRKIFVLQMKRR